MSPAPVETIRVKRDEEGLRLDRWFKIHFPEVGYTYLQKLLRSGQVRINSRRVEANERLAAGQEIRVPAVVRQPKSPDAMQQRASVSKADRDLIEGMILYEDEHVLVLNKPFGLAVQGGTGTKRHIDGILAGMEDRFGDRPRLVSHVGMCHRRWVRHETFDTAERFREGEEFHMVDETANRIDAACQFETQHGAEPVLLA